MTSKSSVLQYNACGHLIDCSGPASYINSLHCNGTILHIIITKTVCTLPVKIWTHLLILHYSFPHFRITARPSKQMEVENCVMVSRFKYI